MADNKNQHFVPRCHLKPFTARGEGKAVHLFNLDADRAISDAPVKNQCSRDNFYGQDLKLEAAIQSMEGAYGGALARLLPEDAVPTEHDRWALRRFILLQHLRTEAASKQAAQATAALAQLPGALGDEPFDIKRAMREAVQHAMHYYAKSMEIVDDLQVTLVRNHTPVPFVTSDDPAVLTNRWYLHNPRARDLTFGVRNAGLMMLLPLSPRALAMLHDPDVYVVPHNRGCVVLDRVEDVTALNEHQALNCAANVYFGDWNGRERIVEAVRVVAAVRPRTRHRVTYAVRDQVVGGHVRYEVRPLEEIVPEPGNEVLIHTETLRARPSRWPSFIGLRRGGRMYTNGTRTGYVRRWCLERGFVDGDGYRRVVV